MCHFEMVDVGGALTASGLKYPRSTHIVLFISGGGIQVPIGVDSPARSPAARDQGTYPVVRIYLRAVGHRQQVLDPSAALAIVTVMSFLRCQGRAGSDVGWPCRRSSPS
jgi:hypothetical protein